MIAAVKGAGGVTVALSMCDSCVTMSDRDLSLADNMPFDKVKGVKNCYIVADHNDYAFSLLRYNPSIFKDITDVQSVITKVVPKMKKVLADAERLIGGVDWRHHLLIIKEDKLYHIDRYFCVAEIQGNISPNFYLQGALDSIQGMSAEGMLVEGLDHASKMANVRLFPAVIYDLGAKKRKVYYSPTKCKSKSN